MIYKSKDLIIINNNWNTSKIIMLTLQSFHKIVNVNKTWLITLILLVLVIHNTHSQSNQLAGTSYFIYPNSGLIDKQSNANFSFQEFGGFVRIPYKFKNETTRMINGISYAYIKSNIDNLPTDIEGANFKIFQAITYQTIIAQKLPRDFNLVFSLKPTIASDFEEKLSSDDFIMQGFLFASKKKSEHLSIGLGLANTMRLGNIFLLPIIPFYYKNYKHTINAVFPLKFDYTYIVNSNETLKIGIRETANGGNINITAPYSSNNITEVDKVNYSRVNIGPIIYYNINKYIQFEMLSGISLRRQYNLLDKEENHENIDLKNTPFFQVGLFLTAPKWK